MACSRQITNLRCDKEKKYITWMQDLVYIYILFLNKTSEGQDHVLQVLFNRVNHIKWVVKEEQMLKMLILQVQQWSECQLQLLQNRHERLALVPQQLWKGEILKGQGKVTKRVCVCASVCVCVLGRVQMGKRHAGHTPRGPSPLCSPLCLDSQNRPNNVQLPIKKEQRDHWKLKIEKNPKGKNRFRSVNEPAN